jgi:phosphoglycolate phosphatase
MSALLGSVEAVLFDLDGVLVDSRVAFGRCVNAALVAHGFPSRREPELHRMIGPPLHETFAELGVGDAVQTCVEVYRGRYVLRGGTETAVVRGIPELLDALAPLPLYVVSSKPKALAEPLLMALGLHRWFVAVEGPDLEVEAETKGETIARALERLPSGARAVIVGDRRFDVVGAAENGLQAVGALWGIGDASELTEAGAAVLADRPDDLVSILRPEPAAGEVVRGSA